MPLQTWPVVFDTSIKDLEEVLRRFLRRRRPITFIQKSNINVDTRWPQEWIDAYVEYASRLSREQLYTWLVHSCGFLFFTEKTEEFWTRQRWPFVPPRQREDWSHIAAEYLARLLCRRRDPFDFAERYNFTNEQVETLRQIFRTSPSRVWREAVVTIWTSASPELQTRLWKDLYDYEYERCMRRIIPLLAQISVVLNLPFNITGLKASMSRLDGATWVRVYECYKADTDALIAGAPALPRSVVIYHGSQWKTKRLRSELVYARSSKKMAAEDGEFIHSIRLPAGLRVLPLWIWNPEGGEVVVQANSVKSGGSVTA